MYQSRIRNAKKRTGRQEKNRTIFEPDDSQDYAIVTSMLGNGRLMATCSDGVSRMARIRGSMRKYGGKVIIQPGDLILVAKRDYEEDKVDVFHKYSHEEVHDLMRWDYLPESIKKALSQGDSHTGAEVTDENIVFFDEGNGDLDLDAI